MKQVLQDPRGGKVEVVEVPVPRLLDGCVLVQVGASLVSAGTERASSEFASKNLLQKAKARPDLVREVINKVRRDGIVSAWSAVRGRLDQPSAVGYSCAGTVVAVAKDITDIVVGDRVACAGAGHAIHGEIACVPRLLVARFPVNSSVTSEHAAFTTLGAVVLHGIRTANVKLGDVVAVIGLGLLGQLAVQVLKAAGCQVIGTDIAPERASLAVQMGADATSPSSAEFRDLCMRHSSGHGVDAVLITAETPSSGPVNLAAEVARDRAVVVAVGTVGMEIERKLYYGKELDFRVSRSYGPGRYDAAYEQQGRDYPIGYVRWTETRNMVAFLQLLAEGKLNLGPLVTHRFPIENATAAYDLITGKTGERPLGVLITYSGKELPKNAIKLREGGPGPAAASAVTIGLLGAGNFALSTLLPAIKSVSRIDLAGVCTTNGVRARHAAEKFGFRYCTTDDEKLLTDPDITTVVIATRHHLHASQVIAALEAGKHVFCEKPLCLTEEELAQIVRAKENASANLQLMVGFNRRFAPMARKAKQFLAGAQGPFVFHYRVNAGPLPPDHWLNDPAQGGGRILGELCHFIDVLAFLTGSAPIEVHTRDASAIGHSGGNAVLWLQFADGSHGTIGYLTSGDRAFSKERIEIFGGGVVVALDDFRCLELVQHGRKQVLHSRLRQDKGHRGEWEALASCIRDGGPSPVPFGEIVASTLATLRALDSRASGHAVLVDVPGFIAASLDAGQSTP